MDRFLSINDVPIDPPKPRAKPKPTSTPVDASDRKFYVKAAESGNKQALQKFDDALAAQRETAPPKPTTTSPATSGRNESRSEPTLTERQRDIDLLVTASPAAAQAMQKELDSDVMETTRRVESLRRDVDALGTAGGYATEVMQAELQGMEAELQRYRGATANRSGQASGEPPTTSTVISADSPIVYTDEGAVKNAYQIFAEQQGLPPDLARDYAERAYELTDGRVHYASGDPDQDGRPLTTAELREQRAGGRLDISPTRAQLGLLHMMAAQDAGTGFPVSGQIGASGVGLALFPGPPTPANVVPGNHTTAADTAVKILEDMADGRPPFRPEVGQRGATQWFVTEGDPHIGSRSPANPVTIPVEINNPTGGAITEFNEQKLLEIYESVHRDAFETVEGQVRQRYGLGPDDALNSRARSDLAWNGKRLAQGEVWTRVGEMIANSDSGIGRVILEEGSFFSKDGAGQFMLTSRPDAVQVRGGAETLVDVIQRTGEPVDDALRESVEKLATEQRWGGRVQGAFKYGGRVLVVVGAAADGYRIYTADNKWQEAAEVAGGWGGATAASAGWAKVASPMLATGPWGWAGYGAGMLVAGGVGYVVGEKVGEEAYELVVDGDPIFIGPEDRANVGP